MFSQQDSFQQQLNDLQRSYAQLGKGMPGARQPRKIRRVSGAEEAKQIARDELLPGDEALRELTKLQSDKSNADQTAYLLSVTGKWVANAPATA